MFVAHVLQSAEARRADAEGLKTRGKAGVCLKLSDFLKDHITVFASYCN